MQDRLALAVAVCALVPSIYGAALPPLSEVRGTSHTEHVSAWTSATATAAAVVLAAAVVSHDRQVMVLGGAMAAAYAALYRTAIRHRPVSP